MNKQLGKIKRVSYGLGGYQDAQFGITFDLGGDGWGVGDFHGTWATHSKGCKWTVEDQRSAFADTAEYIRDLLKAAKVHSVDRLVGIPVEVTFDGNCLKSWRVLTEVL